MKNYKSLAVALLSVAVITAAAQPGTSVKQSGAIKVEVRKTGDSYRLYRGDVAYFIKGAGGSIYPDRIAAYGGNSIRTWGTRGAQKTLDSAQRYGLTVLLGLDAVAERHGFNYDDTAAVRKQFERIRDEVRKYKDNPAVLAWGIGNELNLQYKNPKVWDAVNEISKMIHQEDPNHPTTTVLAGVNKSLVDYLKERTQDIDFLAINTYAGLATLPGAVRTAGWERAYMVTEWGPTGHWEGLQTEWKSPIEETSSEKAGVYKSRYEYGVEKDRDKCLGSYVFLWGQKQERTPTWYGIFTDKGEESEVVDVMQYLWSGSWPKNQAPHVYSLQVDKKKILDNLYLKPGNSYSANVMATDPDRDKLTYRWELLPEPTQVGNGGDFEAKPKAIEGAVTGDSAGNASFKTPATEGAYRLFVYVTDGNNNVATANFPFFVKQ